VLVKLHLQRVDDILELNSHSHGFLEHHTATSPAGPKTEPFASAAEVLPVLWDRQSCLQPLFRRLFSRSGVLALGKRRLKAGGTRKLPSSTNNLLGWVLPPLVIHAFEAH
jgi:hypothetical protein